MIRTPRAGRTVRAHPPVRPARPGRPARCEPLEPRRLLAATLLKDINPATLGSWPQELTEVNGTLFFGVSNPPATKWTLYKSDGTAAGTRPVIDAYVNSPKFSIELTPTANGTLFFVGDTPYDGAYELRKTDGTAAGTVLVKDVQPGFDLALPRDLTAARNTLFFVADDGVHGEELWKSNGTEAGTVRLTDLRPGADSADPRNLTAVGNRIFFTALAPGEDDRRDLWTSDGTEAGTRLVKAGLPLDPGPSPSPNGARIPSYRNLELAGAGGLLYFVFDDDAHGRELWKTDGTAAGTALVSDAFPGAQGSNPHDLTPDGNALLLAAAPDADGSEAWRTDGTPAGTVALTDVSRGGTDAAVGELTPLGTAVFFRTASGALYRTERGPGTTTRVGDFPTGTRAPMTTSGGKLYFTATDLLSDTTTVYASDGTAGGTVALRTFLSATPPVEIAPFRGGVALSAEDETAGRELWVSDGTPGGTRLVVDLNKEPQGSLVGSVGVTGREPVVVRPAGTDQPRLVFLAEDIFHSRSLWSTDGTTTGTVRVMHAGHFAYPNALASLGDRAVFAVEGENDPLHRAGLWATDGTPQGTHQLTGAEIRLEPFSQTTATRWTPKGFTASGGYVYFLAAPSGDPSNYDLWRTDGTIEGTGKVADLPAGAGTAWGAREFTDVNGTLFFVADSGPQGQTELWRSDGTAEGTFVVKAVDAHHLTGAGGRLFFMRGNDPEAWTSDGTAEGTVPLLPGSRGVGSTSAAEYGVLGGRVVFARRDGFLWISDGTPAGTMPLKEFDLTAFTTPPDFHSAGDKVFFTAFTYPLGRQLWVTDGTADGTHMVGMFAPRGTPTITMLHAADGLLYFTVMPPGAEGVELWVSDGTAGGTRLVAYVRPGRASSFPARAATVGDKVVFWADDGVHGYEPWVAAHDPAAAAAAPRVVARRAFYNHSAFDGGDASPTAADDAAVAPGRFPVLSGDDPTIGDPTNYARGLNGVFVDIAGLPAGANLSADDFTFRRGNLGDSIRWAPAEPPQSVTVRRGAGVGGSDRITLVWPDYDSANPNATVANDWLEVTVKSNGNTGLSSPDLFAFSNVIGDADGDGRVSAFDLGAVKARLNTPAGLDSPVDFNRDGRVNALDLAMVKRYLGWGVGVVFLPAPLIPAPSPAAVSAPALLPEPQSAAASSLLLEAEDAAPLPR
jgi:ELWxxDGT repeat protein